MKFLLFIALAVVYCSAQSDSDIICCFSKLASGGHASTCTPGIKRGLCLRAEGLVDAPSTETCCCYGQNAAPSDKCLPDVLKSTCLGTSVRGRCEPAAVSRCCCIPAGADPTNCVPRIPLGLCEKTIGAQCYAAPSAPTTASPTVPGATTTSSECTCVIQRASGPLTLTLSRVVCAKYQGVCQTSSPTPAPSQNTDCCCIYDGAVHPGGAPVLATDIIDPSTLSPPLCLVNTPISQCVHNRKRVGACWTGPIPTTVAPTTSAPTVAPRCFCKDPNSATGAALQDDMGNDAYILEHVCKDKLGSQCVEERCCCKFPSAQQEPCIPNIRLNRCYAINGAECVNTYVFPSATTGGAAADNNLFSWASPSATTGAFTHGAPVSSTIDCTTATGTATNDPRVTVKVTQSGGPSSALVNNLAWVPQINNLSVFIQQLSGLERVFLQRFASWVTVDVSPEVSGFLLYAINWKGDSNVTASSSVYNITVTPATSIPRRYSDARQGGLTNAVIAPTATAGKYTVTFPNTAPLNGIFDFSGPVSQVTVAFPAGGAESSDYSGIIPALISANNGVLALPAASTSSSSAAVVTQSTTAANATSTAATAVSVVCTGSAALVSTDQAVANVEFSLPCGNTDPTIRDTITIDLSGVVIGADTLIIDTENWLAGVYNFVQTNVGGVAAAIPTIESGFTGAGAGVTEVGGVVSFTITSDSTAGSIRIHGVPSSIVIIVPNHPCATTRRQVTQSGTFSINFDAAPVASTNAPVNNVDPYADPYAATASPTPQA